MGEPTNSPERNGQPGQPGNAPNAEHEASPDTGSASGTPAPPVPEPTDSRSAQALAALMFKPPLDPARRVPAAPDPGQAPAQPRGGTRPELPFPYGARPIPAAPGGGLAQTPPPPEPTSATAPNADTAVRRAALPSLAKQNRRYRAAALWGGGCVVAIVAGGAWVLGALAASWL